MKAAIFYTDGLADSKAIQDFILESLVLEIPDLSLEPDSDNYSLLKNHMLTVGDIKDAMEFHSLLNSLLSGDVILLLDGYAKGFTIGMRGWKDRGVWKVLQKR